MSAYLLLKWVHILSSTLLFGTGLGTAFYMWQAHRSGDVAVLAQVSRSVVLADWIFTTPAVVVQPLTGIAMVLLAGFPVTSPWLLVSLLLYVFIGACWLPVVWLQMRVRDMATTACLQQAPLDTRAHRYMRYWYILGWPAFLGVMLIFALMVFKPSLW